MIMKKTHILPLLLSAVTMSSCKFETEDIFDEQAANRIEHTCEDIEDKLVAASAQNQNGWVLQYFVSGTDEMSFEGFNLFARFRNDGTVLFAGDHRYLRNNNANKYTESVSLYSVLREEGPVISFNTWNDVFTPFSDPVNPQKAPTIIEKDGEGMGGDINLVVKSFNANEIILRGERFGSTSRLIRCDRSWEQYIEDTKKLKAFITSDNINSYVITNGTDTMYLCGVRTGSVTYTEKLDDPLQTKTLACVFTPTGIRFEKETAIGKNTFQELNLNDQKTMLVNEDGSITCHAMWNDYFANNDLWIIDVDELNDSQKELCKAIETSVKTAYPSFSLRGVGIGNSKGKDPVKGLVLVFYKNTSKTACISAGMEMNFTLSAPEVETISSATNSCDYNMKVIEEKVPGVKAQFIELSKTFVGDYSLVPDSYFSPTVFTLTDKDGKAFKAVKDNNRIVIE